MILDKMVKRYLYIGGVIVLIYLLFNVFKGFIWFVIQTFIYAVLILVLLFYLKKKGFFNS